MNLKAIIFILIVVLLGVGAYFIFFKTLDYPSISDSVQITNNSQENGDTRDNDVDRDADVKPSTTNNVVATEYDKDIKAILEVQLGQYYSDDFNIDDSFKRLKEKGESLKPSINKLLFLDDI